MGHGFAGTRASRRATTTTPTSTQRARRPPVTQSPRLPPARQIAYGDHPDQVGNLHLPSGDNGPWPTVVLIHGGFWRWGWDRTLMTPLARDLAGARFRRLEHRIPARRAGGRWLARDARGCRGGGRCPRRHRRSRRRTRRHSWPLGGWAPRALARCPTPDRDGSTRSRSPRQAVRRGVAGRRRRSRRRSRRRPRQRRVPGAARRYARRAPGALRGRLAGGAAPDRRPATPRARWARQPRSTLTEPRLRGGGHRGWRQRRSRRAPRGRPLRRDRGDRPVLGQSSSTGCTSTSSRRAARSYATSRVACRRAITSNRRSSTSPITA